MIQMIYRLICGYVYLCFSGKDAKRCLNLCVRQKISVWSVKTIDDKTLQLYMMASDLKKCKNCLKKTHTKVKILKKRGIPFVRFRYRKRIVFPIALFAIMLLLLYYSQFIWKIQVIGNSNLSEETIIEYLGQKNSAFGNRKAKIDCQNLELSLRKDFSQIIWSSVYIEGTKLIVEVQENINQLKDNKGINQSDVNHECYDLVADKDAVIESIVTRKGTPCVVSGQEVKKGDVLVLGRQEILDDNGEIGTYYYQSADADVYGIVTYEYSDSFPVEWSEKVETGKKRIQLEFRVNDWALKSPLLFPMFDNYYTIEEYNQLCISDNFYLPLFFEKKEYKEYKKIKRERDDVQAKKIAKENLSQFLEELKQNGVQIIDKNVMISRKNNNFIIKGNIKACESITNRVQTERKEIQQEGTTIDEHE